MLTERLLDRTPVWLLYAGTALLLFAASGIGFRIAVWRSTRRPPRWRIARPWFWPASCSRSRS
jgi:hypothetical protein